MAAAQGIAGLLGTIQDAVGLEKFDKPWPKLSKNIPEWFKAAREHFNFHGDVNENVKFRLIIPQLPRTLREQLFRYMKELVIEIIQGTNANYQSGNDLDLEQQTFNEMLNIDTIEEFIADTQQMQNTKPEMISKLSKMHYPKQGQPSEVLRVIQSRVQEINDNIRYYNASIAARDGIDPESELDGLELLRIVIKIFGVNNDKPQMNNEHPINRRIVRYLSKQTYESYIAFVQDVTSFKLDKVALPQMYVGRESFMAYDPSPGELSVHFTKDNNSISKPKLQFRNKRNNNSFSQKRRIRRWTERRDKSKQICRFYRIGKCTRGNKCRFYHPKIRNGASNHLTSYMNSAVTICWHCGEKDISETSVQI